MAPDMNLPNTVAAGFCHDLPRLLQLFEGLGENCDFGVVQRAIGIEPVGLFRFGACNAADIKELLRTRFESLGDAQDLWLDRGRSSARVLAQIAPQLSYSHRIRTVVC